MHDCQNTKYAQKLKRENIVGINEKLESSQNARPEWKKFPEQFMEWSQNART